MPCYRLADERRFSAVALYVVTSVASWLGLPDADVVTKGSGAALAAVLMGCLLAASCSGSSNDTAKRACHARYPRTTAVEEDVAGHLRNFALRGKAPGHFFGLADSNRVTLCLVPDSSGHFTVFGLPQGGGPDEALWVQDDGHRFIRPI